MNIVLKFLITPILLVVSMYWQHDYNLTIERVEVLTFNKDFFYLIKTHNFKFNRTNFGLNMTFNVKQQLGNDLKIQLQAYRFASNEYRLFPVRFIFDVCDTISKNDFGLQSLYNCGNFPRCPMKRGNYTTCNWSPDESRFPPYLPGGRYKCDLTLIYKSVEISGMETYAEVKPKNKWEMEN